MDQSNRRRLCCFFMHDIVSIICCLAKIILNCKLKSKLQEYFCKFELLGKNILVREIDGCSG